MRESSQRCVAHFIDSYLSSRTTAPLRVVGVESPTGADGFADLFEHARWEYLSLAADPRRYDRPPNEIEPLPYLDHSIDVIVCGASITRMTRPWLEVSDWSRLLVDGGLLCVVAPATGPDDEVLYRFLPDGLASLTRAAGLTPVELSRTAPSGWSDTSGAWTDTMVIAVKGAGVTDAPVLRTTISAPGVPQAEATDVSGFEKAAAVWSSSTQIRLGESDEAEHARRSEWTYHPLVAARLDQRGGGPFFDWVARTIDNPAAKLVSIGCGAASFEVDLLINGVVSSLVLVDIAEGSLDQARAKARDAGVFERITFASTPITPSTIGAYLDDVDVVFATDSLHHIADVGDVIRVIHDSMRPGTRFIARDYVGPNRFAFEPEVIEIARNTYRGLPESVRSPWPDLSVPDPVEVERYDPTEAVDSEAIIPAIHSLFDDFELTPIGGALSHVIWYSLDHDAVFETDEGPRAVAEILDLEDRLMADGQIPTYFVRFVATR